MRAGRLRHRITIQQPSETRGTDGEPTPTWSEYATAWASVEPLSGRELFSAQQANSVVSHRVSLRYTAGVTPRMRVLFGTRVLTIESVIDVEERARELVLMCREIA